MAKRDFSKEGYFNIFLRFFKAAKIRFRGRLFYLLGVFHKHSSKKISFGHGIKIKNGKWILFGRSVGFGDYCRIEAYAQINDDYLNEPKIEIGSDVSFGDFVHIGAINKIIIGNNVLGAGKILIIDHDHGKAGIHLIHNKDISPRDRELFSKGPIIIERNVWIGEGAIILAGAHIGSGAVIGANAIVNCKVEPNTVFISKKNYPR